MPNKLSIALSGIVFSTAVALAPTAASAQQSTASGAAATAPMAKNVSDADLQKFISAAKKVSVLTNEYAPKVKAEPSNEGKQKVIAQANKEMASAVEAEGLSVDKFVAIDRAAQQDPKLQQRLQKIQK